MSRTRKALIAAGFSYVQFALAMLGGLVLIPLILGRLDVRTYGLWLASGEGLAYVATIDLGVFGVLPWMVAAADGRDDRPAIRGFIVNGLIFGGIAAACYVAIVGVMWWLLPGALGLTVSDRTTVGGPLALLVAVTAVAFPLRAFRAVLIGLQDVVFNGAIALLQVALTVGITVVLLLHGWGLYGLAIAAAVPPALTTLLAVARTRKVGGRLFAEWPAPSVSGIVHLVREGLGGWLSVFGVQLLVASNALIITYLGHPEAVAVYVVTAKLSQVLLQMSWVLPDSGLVGLAQLHGEGRPARTRQIVLGMLRLHLVLSGAAALVILLVNPRFVTLWVGPGLFGGESLNAALAVGCVALSVTHGVVAAASVIGNRLKVGLATLANGAVHVVLAVLLGAAFGLVGVALATAVSGVITTLPVGVYLLQRTAGVDIKRSLLTDLVGTWLWRALPVFAVAAGLRFLDESVWLTVTGGLVLGLCYLVLMRSFCRELPLSARVQAWLARIPFAPIPETASAAVDRRAP